MSLLTNRKISAFIFLFPAIVLFIYAMVSYFIIFSSENKNSASLISFYKYEFKKEIKKETKKRAMVIDNFINKTDSSEYISKFLNSIDLPKDEGIILFDKNGTEVFIINSIDKKSLSNFKKVDNSQYEDSRYIAYILNNNKTGYKIISFKDYKNGSIKEIENEIYNNTKENIKKSLFWLALIWFLLLFVSVYLSFLVFNRLKDYEKTIENNKKRIIFQSRQAMLGELLPMIAHQWRQPLNKISSIVMRMRLNIATGAPNIQNLDRNSQIIEDSVDLMSQTIEDFRTFYSPKDEESEADISEIIRKAIYFLDEALQKKKIRISTDLEKITTKVHANELLQVIINLIKNASDAIGEKGEINISLKEISGNKIEIRVEDDGTGIPEDKLDKIFEAHESSKQASMGLGLYMAKLIIESRFKGSIKAYNTHKGAGFLIILPKK